MRLNRLIYLLELVPLTHNADMNTELEGCYICDLLSHAMKRLKRGNIWITVQTSPNVVAVAALTEVGCVIIPENISVGEDVVKLAEREWVVILSSSMSSYEIAARLLDM